ncbi:MAG: AMP-binding protein [Gammaproteobacteria bacterium]|nr:AMP-binding protein [Gammaproteobacteria bacterium]MBU1480481.1 AMP-binding protein [Gammaproteobacteria bacterium]
MEKSYISPEEAVTLHGIFLERVKRTPDTCAYRHFDNKQEKWISFTWREMLDQVARWQAALLRENLTAGDRVAVRLRNCPQWVMFEQAAMSLGLVLVPLYVEDRPDNISYIVNDAQVKVILFETAEQWQDLWTVIGHLGCVKRFVSLDEVAADGESRLSHVDAWLPARAELQPERKRDRNELATIMYTSGTTGKPKGVMLSHHNIVYNAHASLQTFTVRPDDCMLSFLPLSHALERMAGYYMPMVAGGTVAYARSIPLLADDLQIIRPTILVAVPRIYERIYNALHAKMEESSALKRWLFISAVKVGWARFEYQQGRRGWSPKLLSWPLFNLLVAGKVMARLGGRMRLSVSGGAALPPKVSELFLALGLPIIQGYGMTETSPVVSVNRVDDNHPVTVGPPIAGIEVKIGPQNALMVRGPSNMLGYWNNPEATAAVVDKEGWLNTGDTASIDSHGCVTITGRLKEIIVMSNGEKLPPGDMEAAILRDQLFEQVVLYGDGRSYLVALAVLKPEQWHVLALQVGVRPDQKESLYDPRVEALVLQRIAEQIKEFPGYAKVRRVSVSLDPWTVENGLQTATLKLKRTRVFEHYHKQIAHLYEGH